MKGWLVRPKDSYGAEIIFAKTRGKAKSLAMSTDCCSEADFVDIEVCRQPHVDKYYKEGKWHLDWENPKDRIILVKECGFTCDPDYFDPSNCENCSAREYCDKYREYLTDCAEEDSSLPEFFSDSDLPKERCEGCEFCKRVHANGNWSFFGCYHQPYRGKWVAQIENCPKLSKENDNDE